MCLHRFNKPKNDQFKHSCNHHPLSTAGQKIPHNLWIVRSLKINTILDTETLQHLSEWQNIPAASFYGPIVNTLFHVELTMDKHAHILHSKHSCKKTNLYTFWFGVVFLYCPFTKFFIHDHSQTSLLLNCCVDHATIVTVTIHTVTIFNVNNNTNIAITFASIFLNDSYFYFYFYFWNYLCYWLC